VQVQVGDHGRKKKKKKPRPWRGKGRAPASSAFHHKRPGRKKFVFLVHNRLCYLGPAGVLAPDSFLKRCFDYHRAALRTAPWGVAKKKRFTLDRPISARGVSEGWRKRSPIRSEGFDKAGAWTVLEFGRTPRGSTTAVCASKWRVGAKGRSSGRFEPSPRERKKAVTSAPEKLNRCRNVRVEALALGNEKHDLANLYVIEGKEHWLAIV